MKVPGVVFSRIHHAFTTSGKQSKQFLRSIATLPCGHQHDVMYRAYQQTRIGAAENLWRERAPRTERAGIDARQAGGTGQHQHAKFAES
jgi:hypothetical protein